MQVWKPDTDKPARQINPATGSLLDENDKTTVLRPERRDHRAELAERLVEDADKHNYPAGVQKKMEQALRNEQYDQVLALAAEHDMKNRPRPKTC